MATNRVTGIDAEVLHVGASTSRVTGIDAEVLHVGASKARVTSIAIEVLIPLQQTTYTGSVSLLWGV